MLPETEKLQLKTPKAVRLPTEAADLVRKRKTLKEELLKTPDLIPTRVAILGGSTTSEIKNMVELFLLEQGFNPSFYESGYKRFGEDVLFENPDLWRFKPDIVFIHTTWHNVSQYPDLLESEAQTEARVRSEMARFEALWEKVHKELGAFIIQNNFDLPRLRPLANLEASESFGRVHFLSRLNAELARYARTHSRFLINDIHYLAAQVGLSSWHDYKYWYSFHMALSPTATVVLAQNVAGIVKAIYGKTKKCLVLDLDNTLWGGIVGDDGVQNLLLGRDHAVGEAFTDFQGYVKELARRGIILAVCSKNDPEIAKEGFSHPDSELKLEDFSAFKANWNPKPQNLREIAAELNIGLDSLVFVDDSPVERAFVADQLPEVAVPDLGSDVSRFAEILEQEHYFEVGRIVQDDLSRSSHYIGNAQRSAAQSEFRDYGEFLASLEMIAEIGPFAPVYLDRITQLINKTNQFNLTTKRYTGAEVEAASRDGKVLTLYGRLADRFGDNGLVSVIIGRVSGISVELDTWLMSCRVLKREMEYAMFDALVEQCQARGVRRIVGTYIPSKKNGLVARHYADLGFWHAGVDADKRETWHFNVSNAYTTRAQHIRRVSSAVPANA